MGGWLCSSLKTPCIKAQSAQHLSRACIYNEHRSLRALCLAQCPAGWHIHDIVIQGPQRDAFYSKASDPYITTGRCEGRGSDYSGLALSGGPSAHRFQPGGGFGIQFELQGILTPQSFGQSFGGDI